MQPPSRDGVSVLRNDARTLQSALPAGPQTAADGGAHVCANCQKPIYAPEGVRKNRRGLMWLGIGCATMAALASMAALMVHVYAPVDLPPPPVPTVDAPPALPPPIIRLGPPPTPPTRPPPLTPPPIFTAPFAPPGNISAPPAPPNEGPAAPNVKPPPMIRIPPPFSAPPKAQPAQ